jgi:carbon monoxide dehydrogenase subunit G
MPYEATVPVHRRLLWPAVTDPERLLGALPNVSIDASGAQGVAGRLRVRTREQTVTFRGVARIVEVVPTALRVSIEVEAVFGRAGGSVEGLVEIVLRKSGSGTRVVVDGQLDDTPGAAPLPAESMDAAFRRAVHRWFTVLAETSPAARPERTDAQSTAEPPRAPERAPLAVVRDVARDVPVDSGAASTASAPVPLRHDAQEDPDPADAYTEAAYTEDSYAADEPEAPAPTPLRLVTPQRDESPEAPDDDGDDEPDPEPGDLDEPEPEDIWSRLRDRSLPPWIPFLVGAATATLAAVAVLFAALRRLRHRDFSGE